jgi:hypothetical protein
MPSPPFPSSSQFSPVEWWMKTSLTGSAGGTGSAARAGASGRAAKRNPATTAMAIALLI